VTASKYAVAEKLRFSLTDKTHPEFKPKTILCHAQIMNKHAKSWHRVWVGRMGG
jgi:hypothetical protein